MSRQANKDAPAALVHVQPVLFRMSRVCNISYKEENRNAPSPVVFISILQQML